jgi:hypothetical protein
MAQTYLTYQQLTPDQKTLYGNESAYNQAVSTSQSTESPSSSSQLGYGPGNQPYTAVMPPSGMKYTYDAQGTRYSVPEGQTFERQTPQPPQPISPAVPGSKTGQLQAAGIGTSGSADPSEFIQGATGLQYAQPTLPDGTKINPQLQQAQTNEMMATPGVSATTPAATSTAATAGTATTTAPASAVQVDPTAFSKQYQTYTGSTVGETNVPQVTAAQQATPTQTITAQQGNIASNATIQGQLAGLQQQVDTAVSQGGNLPAWAVGAQRLVDANMAKRGMGASSMYAEALATGIMQSAIPIAQSDANAYKEMIFANLNNRQQTAVQNAQNSLQLDVNNLSNRQQAAMQNSSLRHNTLLSDQSATNAAEQFNSTSQSQTDQFFDNLGREIKTNNATRSDAMNQFSSAEQNKIAGLNANNQTQISESNAQREDAISQFNSQLTDQRDRFNVENQRVVDQSNVVWRRNINTANTAQINAANQTNAANKLNISNFAMSALWQQWRDEAQWAMQSSENGENRAHALAVAALGRQTAFDLNDQAANDKLHGLMGQFATNLIFGV